MLFPLFMYACFTSRTIQQIFMKLYLGCLYEILIGEFCIKIYIFYFRLF